MTAALASDDLLSQLSSSDWVFWIKLSQPDPEDPSRFRVCVVVKGEPGHYEMGNEEKMQAPWYWDEETCRKENSKRGFTLHDTAIIIASSMAAQNRRY